jgi:Ala-tRNA(Pro) deacylase
MSPPLTPNELFDRLDALGIAHKTYTHPPVFTVAEAVALRGQLPGGHCKSLFLKDKKGGSGSSSRSRNGRSI